jgi:hypothetical protein
VEYGDGNSGDKRGGDAAVAAAYGVWIHVHVNLKSLVYWHLMDCVAIFDLLLGSGNSFETPTLRL